MGYRHTTFKGTSYALRSADPVEDFIEHELEVTFKAQVGYDMVPYGSTYARKDEVSIEEAEEYWLDGVLVTLQYLNSKFNPGAVGDAIEEASQESEEE